MRLPELAILYALIGIGAAAGLIMVRRPITPGSMVDAALLGGFWPLYGPFLLLQERESEAASRRSGAEDGEGQAGDSVSLELPLASLLPDRETAEALERRLSLAQTRVEEIDRLLMSPELDEARIVTRLEELESANDDRAAAAVRQRLQSVHRLGELRLRFSAELTEIRELLAQFRIQAEVVRLAGEDDGRATRELLNELHLRLETLDEMLADDSQGLAPDHAALP